MDVRGIDQDSRLRILRLFKSRYGYRPLCRMLGISSSSLHRYLKGVRRIPDSLTRKMLQHLSEEELMEILLGGEKLKVLGFIREDGSIDYSMAVEFLKIAFQDEYLRSLILDFVVKEYREDLKKMLGISLSAVEFRWSPSFEEFLMHRKRRRKVSSMETVNYYRGLFMRHLEGRRLSMSLIDEVVNHPNKWLRNIFRHYIQYLYHRRLIPPEAYGWLTLVVPSRSYKMEPRPYPIRDEDVRRTLQHLKENHEAYYTIYRFMLESGVRIVHALRIIRSWNPEEEVEVPGLGFTRRLIVLDTHARYYAGFRDVVKRCEWVYFSLETLKLLEKYGGRKFSRRSIYKYVSRRGLLHPKYMRKYSWRIMVKTLGRELARFLQSRFGELKISELRYEDLLGEADEAYPKYLNVVKALV